MLTPETIASPANPLVKEVGRAVARGELTAGGCSVAESFHLLEEALRSPCQVETVLAAESARAAVVAFGPRLDGVRVVLLPDALFAGIAATETSQGVMALVRPREWKFPQLLRGKALVVVLDGIQDPGNAGTVVRAAEAFGATGVLFLKGTVSPHNPKTLRASAGSLFRVPFLHGVATATAVATLRQNGVKLFAAMPPSPLWSSLPGCHDPIPGGIPPAPPIPFHHPPPASATSAGSLAATDLTCRCALIVGNEARGVSAVWRTSAAPVSIPTVGVESLNAAIAAAILLYEARRQRMSRP